MRGPLIFFLCCIVINSIDLANGKITPSPSPTRTRVYGSRSSSSSSSGEGPTFPEPALPPAGADDKKNATAIVDSKFDEKVIASVLTRKSLEHRRIINNEITNIQKGKAFVKEKYLPTHSKNPPFKDLCFSLFNYPIKVLAMYLGEFLHRKDETYIIMVLTLCQQMQQLTYIYDRNHKNSLKKRRRKQRHPFANLMAVWVARDRDPDNSIITEADIIKDTESLKNEYPKWNDERDSLENTLIRKCFKFALRVIQKFEADLKINIVEAIKQKIKNHDLVDAYTSLALYVKNRFHYQAKTLLEHSSSIDRWAIWIMYIGFIDSKDWPDIDTEFKLMNNQVSLREHILNNPEPDKVLLQAMAVMIDPTYKPDLF